MGDQEVERALNEAVLRLLGPRPDLGVSLLHGMVAKHPREALEALPPLLVATVEAGGSLDGALAAAEALMPALAGHADAPALLLRALAVLARPASGAGPARRASRARKADARGAPPPRAAARLARLALACAADAGVLAALRGREADVRLLGRAHGRDSAEVSALERLVCKGEGAPVPCAAVSAPPHAPPGSVTLPAARAAGAREALRGADLDAAEMVLRGLEAEPAEAAAPALAFMRDELAALLSCARASLRGCAATLLLRLCATRPRLAADAAAAYAAALREGGAGDELLRLAPDFCAVSRDAVLGALRETAAVEGGAEERALALCLSL